MAGNATECSFWARFAEEHHTLGLSASLKIAVQSIESPPGGTALRETIHNQTHGLPNLTVSVGYFANHYEALLP